MLFLTLLNIAAVGGTGVPCEYWLCEESATGPYSKLNVSSLDLQVYVLRQWCPCTLAAYHIDSEWASSAARLSRYRSSCKVAVAVLLHLDLPRPWMLTPPPSSFMLTFAVSLV